jgi:hypothetical protein
MKSRLQQFFAGRFPGIFRLYFMPILIIPLVMTCHSPASHSMLPDNIIDVWYGDVQSFGMKGNPQRWINIHGTVRSYGIQNIESTFVTILTDILKVFILLGFFIQNIFMVSIFHHLKSR